MKAGAFSTSDNKNFELLIGGRRNSVRRLTLGESRAHLWSLVKKAPEVVVKVSGGGKTTQHVLAHMDYITRNGELEAHMDQGEIVTGRDGVRDLLDAWDLDISNGQGKFKQAFNIVLSMPAGTPPEKVLGAAQKFAREKFWGDHQYMMVLHEPETDTHKDAPEHPHVHLVVKAENTQGKRLYIRKATLEEWRQDFAQYMREQGVEAMATPREVRGVTMKAKKSKVYHAEKRGESTVLKKKVAEVARELQGETVEKPWEDAISARRVAVVRALLGAAQDMDAAGDRQLAAALRQNAKDLPPLATERDHIKRQLVANIESGRARGRQSVEQGHDTKKPNKER